MAHQHESGSGKSPAQGTRRRSLLRAGLALPLGSTALLAACGGGGNGGGFQAPLAPAATVPPPAPEAAMEAAPPAAVPAPAPVAVQAPPVDAPPPKPVEKAVKNVRVLNLQTPTYRPPLNQRTANEDIKTYTQRALKEKFDLLRDALTAGLPKKSAESDLCYFVVPEFFWNVNWDAVKNEADIKVFSNTCVTEVQKHVRALIALFPQEQYGKLALLPGTAQVLMKQIDGTTPATAPAGAPVADKDLPGYEALNYVLVIDNFSKPNPDGSRPIAMWPKRNVSGIDFDTYNRTSVSKAGRAYWKVRLSPAKILPAFNILVQQKSTTTAAYYADGKEFKGFDNDPLGGVPFGVDVCLDYASAYTDNEYLRMSQIEDTNYLIDFLIACGMTVSPTHKYLPSVQYIVRNDGMDPGSCEIYKLAAPETGKPDFTVRPFNVPIPQTAVATLKNITLFDSYFDIHPLWQYPATDIPTETLPSPFAPAPADPGSA